MGDVIYLGPRRKTALEKHNDAIIQRLRDAAKPPAATTSGGAPPSPDSRDPKGSKSR